YRLMFVEEPVLSEHVDSVVDVLRQSPIPIALAAAERRDRGASPPRAGGAQINTANMVLAIASTPIYRCNYNARR
ncbi:hypothetical protein AB0F65_34340, partial [Nocardia rhamnosiphila]|uniref:hypothetical protein n=1 Tax=Nocardia rhamnosiphila TaxID=426716 RepID=UPI0034014843